MSTTDGLPQGAWLHVRVEGRVQGVGFRWFAREAAVSLGLAGWVRNLADGSVEVSAVGRPESIATLRARLTAGPRHARVDQLVDLTEGARPDGTNFEIVSEPRP